MKIEHRFKFALAAIVLMMMFVAAMTYREHVQWESTFAQLNASIAREKDLADLLTLLRDAETGQRGYVITGKDSFLAPYHSAVRAVPAVHAALLNDYSASPVRMEAVVEIFRLVELKLAELEETIRLRRTQGFDVVEPVVSSERGKQYMDELRERIGEQAEIESTQRDTLRRQMHDESVRTFYFINGAALVNFLLLIGLMGFMFRLLKDRSSIAATLQHSASSLEASAASLEDRNRQMALGAEMLQALGTVSSMRETSDIMAIYCAKILPGASGVLYLYRNSRDLLEAQFTWGAAAPLPLPFEPGDCWALRRGQPHATRGQDDLCCAHYRGVEPLDALRRCLPLVTHGEVIGMLYLVNAAGHAGVLQMEQEALRLAEQISLALSNVKLRETLLRQSIVDPLTGMYNRRYMDETLLRELPRAGRKKLPMSLIMLDLDHFKRINDTWGHDAGDFVLKNVAVVINANIRESDLACRFGGEELILILPECDMATAAVRAETIRQAITTLTLEHQGRLLGPVTASFGVATYPQQAHDAAGLLAAADEALYRAKHAGRNRVVSSSVNLTMAAVNPLSMSHPVD